MPIDLGASIPSWSGRRATDALNRVKAEGRRAKRPCCVCEQPINYDLPSTEPDGCTVQHLKSRKLFPELTWSPSNWAPAHNSCNQSAGTGENAPVAGVTSQDW